MTQFSTRVAHRAAVRLDRLVRQLWHHPSIRDDDVETPWPSGYVQDVNFLLFGWFMIAYAIGLQEA